MDAACHLFQNSQPDLPSDYALLNDGIALDQAGAPVTCPQDAALVRAYCFHGLQLCAASADAELDRIADRLAAVAALAGREHYRRALQALRAELATV